ncbi:MAG: IS110 family transposase [Deltaproteobacteria bacterium]|jgi:transposase|nr:IS110 family transposase [Deltaproteobacteria bacterium]
MKRIRQKLLPGERIFVGIDLHNNKWHVTVRTAELELFSGSIPGSWNALKRILDRHKGHRIGTVYEAGYFGFWLYDKLIEYGAECIVTPPSLIPQEYGNKVKTDRRDSRKLAHFLAKGMLKRVWVPTEKERYHRQVIRRRRQLIRDRTRTQSRIKAELRLHGLNISSPYGKWTKIYLENLDRIRFNNRWMQESFKCLLEQYHFLDEQINKQTELLRKLSETKLYKERVEILMTIPGIGMIAAMELLLELQDIKRFQRADQLAAYVGLTPSQYTSADKVRMGRITCVGKNSLRAMLIQASWSLIRKDGVMREKYDRLKSRSGGKRAIVAVARTLLIRMRRLLLDNNPYVVGLIGTI